MTRLGTAILFALTLAACPRNRAAPGEAAPKEAGAHESPSASAKAEALAAADPSGGPIEGDAGAAPLPADVEVQATVALKTLPAVPEGAWFVKTALDGKAMSRVLGASLARKEIDAGTLDMNRELARFAADFRLFTEGDASTVTSRSSTPIPEGTTVSTSPVLWRSDEGTFLVATGRSRASSVIVAFRINGEKAELVTAFVMRSDVAPVVLAFDRRARKELYWSSCWKCPGEHGAVSPREGGRLVIVQY